jgi:hypothetical protein
VKGDGNMFNCQMCSLRWCLCCDVPFHEGQTCEEHLEKKFGCCSKEEERQLAAENQAKEEREKKLLAARQTQEESASTEITRPCPHCKAKIFRVSGCDHMTCKSCIVEVLNRSTVKLNCNTGKCSYQFCWLCSAPYNGSAGIRVVGNSAHKRTCRHYRP